MKRIAIAMGLLASLTCFQLPAQTLKLKATIPFEFHMGKVLMPAGVYTVLQSGSTVTVKTAEGPHQSAIYLTRPSAGIKTNDRGLLTFNRYGNDYFLAKIWGPDSIQGQEMPTTA